MASIVNGMKTLDPRNMVPYDPTFVIDQQNPPPPSDQIYMSKNELNNRIGHAFPYSPPKCNPQVDPMTGRIIIPYGRGGSRNTRKRVINRRKQYRRKSTFKSTSRRRRNNRK